MNEKLKARIAAINSGKVPKGYKKTTVGIVPVEWETKKLGEVLYKVSNGVEVKNDTLYQQIGIRSHGKGIFYKEIVFGSELGNKSVFWVEPDCFVLNIVFAWEQAIGRTTKKEIGMIASHRFPMFKPSGIDVDYLVLYLLTKRGTVLLDLASPGGAGRNRTLGQDAFLNSKVSLPPLPEQQKIAEILSTQDKLIELHEKKIEQLKELKKGYLQKMFPKKGSKYPELRLKGFTDAWEQRKLEQIADRFDNLRVPVAANMRIPGDTPYYGANGIQDYVSGFTHEGEFVLVAEDGANDLKNYPVQYVNGRIWVNNHAHVLQGKDKIASNLFLSYSIHRADIESLLVGGGRAKLNAETMMKIELLVPTLSEQEKIGAYFSKLDDLITLHQRKLEQEKQKKKALMQLLLTGKARCV